MKKYCITMIENGTEFSFPVLARFEQSARNKARKWYPLASIISVQYLGFYLSKTFVSVNDG